MTDPILPSNPGPRGSEILVVPDAPVPTEQTKAWIMSRQVGKSVRTDFTNQEKAESVARLFSQLLNLDQDSFHAGLAAHIPMPERAREDITLFSDSEEYYTTPFALIQRILHITTGRFLVRGTDSRGMPGFSVVKSSYNSI